MQKNEQPFVLTYAKSTSVHQILKAIIIYNNYNYSINEK